MDNVKYEYIFYSFIYIHMKNLLTASFLALGVLVISGCSTNKVEYNQDSWKTTIPQTCKSFFDGCNNCNKGQDSKEAACTMMACETYQEPKCLDTMDPSWDTNSDGINDCE